MRRSCVMLPPRQKRILSMAQWVTPYSGVSPRVSPLGSGKRERCPNETAQAVEEDGSAWQRRERPPQSCRAREGKRASPQHGHLGKLRVKEVGCHVQGLALEGRFDELKGSRGRFIPVRLNVIVDSHPHKTMVPGVGFEPHKAEETIANCRACFWRSKAIDRSMLLSS